MRVLAVTHSLGTNGAAVCLYHLLVAVKAAGGSADVLYTGNEPLADALRAQGVGVVQTAQTGQYDVAVVNTLPDHARVVELAVALPVVFWVHEGASMLGDLSASSDWVRAFESSSRVVFDTPWQHATLFSRFLQRVERHRISDVAPGVGSVAPRAVPRDGPPTVLSIGSVYPRKRPQDLVHAVMRLPAPRPRCVLVGSLEWNHINDPSMAAAIAANPETFTLTGMVERPSDYFSSASVYCTASGDETFGMAVVEAALAGVPLALSDLPCYEGIWKHGVNALLAPVGAVDCIAWNLRALLEDAPLAARLTQAARQTAARFSMDRFLRGMSDALVQAIQDPMKIPGRPR